MPHLPAGALPLHPHCGHIPRSPSPQHDLLNPPLISLDEPRLPAPRPWKSAFTAARRARQRCGLLTNYSNHLLILYRCVCCSEELAMTSSQSTTLPLVGAVEVCAGCRLPIEDRFLLRVMDASWHEACLQCSACCEPLRQSCFVKDRRLLCRQDYDKYAAWHDV